MTSTQADTAVTTVVQQIDAQGPVVIDRISTQFADIACSPENVRNLIEGLRNGAAVTLTDSSGKTATFTPTGGNLGYGEAYIALALAAEALKSAGVTGCATADQWKAVLLGGPLTAAGGTSTSTSTTSTASSSSNFPGVLKLHSQGQGWGQIAKTTNVQLGQVVSSARSSLNISESDNATSSLSPTGRTSAEMNRADTSSAIGTTSTRGTTSTTPTTSGTTSTTPTTSGMTSTTPDSTPSSTSSGQTEDDDKPGKGKGKGHGKAKGHDNDTPGLSKGHDRDSDSTNSSSSSNPGSSGR